MRCAGCPLYTSWNNESDSGEACGLFGDAWDSPFQYEDKDGSIVGCYIDRHFIEKTDEAYQEYLQQEADSLEAWMLEKEKAEGGDQGEENQEYQAAVVYQEYCERYEPTYNPEDGSM